MTSATRWRISLDSGGRISIRKLIVDVGCTIGHNTAARGSKPFPSAEVHGLDVASRRALQYGHARAEALGVAIHFGKPLCDCAAL